MKWLWRRMHISEWFLSCFIPVLWMEKKKSLKIIFNLSTWRSVYSYFTFLQMLNLKVFYFRYLFKQNFKTKIVRLTVETVQMQKAPYLPVLSPFLFELWNICSSSSIWIMSNSIFLLCTALLLISDKIWVCSTELKL